MKLAAHIVKVQEIVYVVNLLIYCLENEVNILKN